MELIRAEPSESDGRLLYRWRQEPAARAASLHSCESFEEFFPRYLRRTLSDQNYFIAVGGKRVGFIGLERCGAESELSILITADERRKGFALEALLLLRPRLTGAVFARVKEENTASAHLFERAGFQLQKREKGLLHFLYPYVRKVSIIAEIGSNWKEDDGTLIARAAASGADAVKFQLFQARSTYAPGAGRAAYLPQKQIAELFDEVALPPEKIPLLARSAEKEGLEFLCSVFSVEELARVDPFVRRHKLASYEICHFPLLRALAKTGKPLLMSTGATPLDEVREAVDFFFACGGKDLTLLQCTACYPAPLSALNLSALRTLQETFALPVGLSDHSEDPLIAPVMAVALGATVIEKHFTLSKTLPGPDHPFAVTPDELRSLVAAVRAAESARGSGIKEVLPEEEELFRFAKRRVQALVEIPKGGALEVGKNIALLRPGINSPGAHPRYLEALVGQKVKRAISAGEGVTLDDLA